MREIKFRAWNKKRKSKHSVSCINFYDEYLDVDEYADGTGERFKLSDVELLQYTGLKDKNGKEIYEGDVLKPIPESPKMGNREVVFLDGSFCYNESKTRGNRGFWALNSGNSKYFEIIGNIYENPNYSTNK